MNNIKTLRKAKKMTQEQLAKKAKLERTFLTRLENGKGNPTQETLGKLAAALDCTITDLI